ncbi:protein OCTOPUS-like [Gastrolobium bilobum]|uniref:protein OCTOPUS-like n=1 Tax=Gastrolobium bilobum TaxID=150636 RepID=UPI002AB2B6B6|nr:protein OCTOPUS-like [Gastrolobium bilobum]
MTSKSHRHRHRLSTCHRHPTIPITGFCASCLRERLAGIDSHDDSTPPPDLRRTKSCSGRGDPSVASASEPRRRSCEVRPRNTLSDLFSLDDERKSRNRKLNLDVETGEEEVEHVNENEAAVRVCEGMDEVDEEETKTMREFIDLELQSKKNAGRDLRSTICEAATVFSEKFRKWKRKHKLKNNRHGYVNGSVEKPEARSLRETQSEIGRRSCDTDPRFSMEIDSCRISVDCPRASWDGCLIGKACASLSPMVSVLEDATDDRVLVEESNSNNVGLENAQEHRSISPGGSSQTKDYYSDSLSWQRRRRSFDIDRSNPHRRQSIGEVDELKMISNAKVSPATTELFYGAKLLITENDFRDSDMKPSSDVQSDCVLGSSSKVASGVANGVTQKGFKKLQKWRIVLNKLGLVQRREDKFGEEESWQKLRRVVNVQASESVSQKLIRSYSVSCRNPCRMAGLVNGLGAPETKENVLNGRQDFMLQRNRSFRYSPNKLDTGLLRFYLTPLKSYRRSKSGKSSFKDLHPIARSVL